MEVITDEEKLWALFYPWASEKSQQLKARNGRFVHYTSAAVALSIITNKSVWMRNARTMNDYLEIEHGKTCLIGAYNTAEGKKLKDFLNGLHPGFTNDLERRFESWLPDLANSTFITCFSEHADGEDELGRLSMWRGYARRNGVALVFNNGPFLQESQALNAFSSPVAYLSANDFELEFGKMVFGIITAEQLVRKFDYDQLMGYIFTSFKFAVLCTKHPGFAEEQEWRVIYSPNFQQSKMITSSTEIVDGVPQIVCKIPLTNVPAEGLVGLEVHELLNRLIIGPSEHALTMFDAFYEAMTVAGIPDAENHIVMSNIPIRQP